MASSREHCDDAKNDTCPKKNSRSSIDPREIKEFKEARNSDLFFGIFI